MTISRNISVMAQGASSSGILAGGYGGLGASISPTTAGNVLFTADGSVWSSTQKIVQGTSVASTSGTSITFTGIPSWVKRVTMMFNGVSTNGTSLLLVQMGAGSIEATGYISTANTLTGGVGGANSSSTAGMLIYSSLAANTFSGHMLLTSMGSNLWIGSSVGKITTAANIIGGSDKTLSGTLDRVRLTTVNGTDTFDAGSVNILYE